MTVIILLIFAGIFNALMDTSSEDRLHSKWWNKTTGANNKWKLGDKANGERFLGSSTVFVFLTDGWHLFQFLFHTSWQLAIAIHLDYWFLMFLLIKTSFSLIFYISYTVLKIEDD